MYMSGGGWKWRKGNNPKPTDSPLLRFWPVMFVLLSSSQQLLNILSDLLGFADDVLCAGKCGVWLHLQIIQLGDRGALPQPAAAPQPPPPAHTSEGRKVRSPARIAAYCFYSAAAKHDFTSKPFFYKLFMTLKTVLFSFLFQWGQTIILTPNHLPRRRWMCCHSHFLACCFASLALSPTRMRERKKYLSQKNKPGADVVRSTIQMWKLLTKNKHNADAPLFSVVCQIGI